MDVASIEAAETELDAYSIERRSRQSSEQRRVEELWAISERRHRDRTRRENRAAWYAHHMSMCDLHRGLAGEHERKALKLLEAE
jgi:hypothetical protein